MIEVGSTDPQRAKSNCKNSHFGLFSPIICVTPKHAAQMPKGASLRSTFVSEGHHYYGFFLLHVQSWQNNLQATPVGTQSRKLPLRSNNLFHFTVALNSLACFQPHRLYGSCSLVCRGTFLPHPTPPHHDHPQPLTGTLKKTPNVRNSVIPAGKIRGQDGLFFRTTMSCQ